VFTFAPSNPILEAMIRIGRIFPRGDRAPFIEPVSENSLRSAIEKTETLRDWKINRTQKISSGFYTSQAMEVCKA
jgi:magnesium-protoporphyrin O-methyltransferase